MSELFPSPGTQEDYSFEIPEQLADEYIWAREEQETLLGRALVPKEEKELWETGEVSTGTANA